MCGGFSDLTHRHRDGPKTVIIKASWVISCWFHEVSEMLFIDKIFLHIVYGEVLM